MAGAARGLSTAPHRCIHDAELAQPNRQQQHPVHPRAGLARVRVGALVGAVVRVE